jgi:hypothetical protein
LPLTLQDEIDGRNFILGLDGIVGKMANGDDELRHGGPSSHERDAWLLHITPANTGRHEAGRGSTAWNGDRLGGGSQRPRVRAEDAGVNAGCADGGLPSPLDAEIAERRGGEDVRRRHHG